VKLSYWLRRPWLVIPRLRYWLWERRNADKPWLTPESIDYLENNLNTTMTGLEFGSGRSTAWFAGKLGRLISVEHHTEWFKTVQVRLADAGLSNVDYRHVPLDHPENEPEKGRYDPQPMYVAVASGFPDGFFDLVVVDGHYRTNCILASLAKVKPGGLLLVDDANLWPKNAPPVPADWTETSRTTNGIKFTVIWRKPV
jgi:predicted O-methyltransferase YrrM